MSNKNLLSGLVKNKELLDLYLKYLHLGREHYSRKNVTAQIKNEKLKLLEAAIRREYKIRNSLIYRLQQEFLQENLSLYLMLEPLATWRYLTTDKVSTGESQIIDVLDNVSSPLARFLMVLNDETPSTYLPMQSLITALMLLQMLADKDAFLQKMKWKKSRQIGILQGLLKEGFVILAVVKSKKLKYRLAVLLNRTMILTEKYAKNEQPTIEFLDAMRIFLYSMYQFLFIKKRTLTKKGI